MLTKLRNFWKPNEVNRLISEWTKLRALPMGRQEFEEWSDRIIEAAMVDADPAGQKFALADMITHLNPTEDHKEDAYFIKRLRKVAQNQVAVAIRQEIKDAWKAQETPAQETPN